MSEKITVPTLGRSVTEATVSKWLKSQGDKVIADEPIVELETDKVNVEVPAPINGTLGSIAVKEGETVNVGSLLGTINNNLNKETENLKEVKKYKPPKKDKEVTPRLFNDDKKKLNPNKNLESQSQESILKLEEETLELVEEPLILDNVHKKIKPSNKNFKSYRNKNILLQEKWQVKLKWM